MAQVAQLVLDSIPTLVQKKDAAGLVALQDHEDKKVRKAVRKALHTLKSRGVQIPDAPARAWTPGDKLASLRGDLTPVATIDTRSAPGMTRFVISAPLSEEGARLYVGRLTPLDRVAEFSAYSQTDGQRARLLKDWERAIEDRRIPVAWLEARVRWAREQTVAAGFTVPRTLDQHLSSFGESPSERPRCFLIESNALQGQEGFDPDKVDEVLIALAAHLWPPLLDLDATLQRAAEVHGDKPQPAEESERTELLRQAVSGDEDVRQGLHGPVANALEDAAVYRWLEGDAPLARAALDMAVQLRDSAEPETVGWAPRLLGYQVASLLRAVGGPDAVRKAMADQTGGHDHDHQHDHDHDHEHGHDHDHHHHDHG